ncbi:MAG: serine hydrolase [Solitalea sp.]
MKNYVLFFIVFVIGWLDPAGTVYAQHASGKIPADAAAKVDALFSGIDKERDPGAAVLVVRNQQVLLKRCYGLANVEHRVPVTPSTVFDIASLSKQFAGMAIAMLEEEGKLSLQDEVQKYIPEFPDFGKPVTIGHLVHHTAGLRDWPATLALAGWRMDDVISLEQILNMAFHQQDLNFEPGAEYSYSNTGYNLLAEIVQRVSGDSFREWTDKHIFKPLGMNNSHFQDNHSEVVPHKAYGYSRAGRGVYQAIPNGLTALGSSSLFTSIDDLAKWVINFETHRVGGKAVWDRMLQRGKLNNGKRISYAYGLVVGTHRGLRTVNHSGGWAGFNTFLLHYPEQNFSVVVLKNHNWGDVSKVAHDIAGIYLEEEMKPERPSADAEEAADPEEVTVPEKLLASYAGTYRLGPAWYITVDREGSRLTSQATGESAVPMVPLSDSSFRVPAYNASISFIRDPGGQVTGFRYRGMTCPRVERVTLPEGSSLDEFTGVFKSGELGTEYQLVLEDGELKAKHPRHGSIQLIPAWKDEFRGSAWFMHTIEFSRDANGQINGFSVSQTRSRKQRFIRQGGLK